MMWYKNFEVNPHWGVAHGHHQRALKLAKTRHALKCQAFLLFWVGRSGIDARYNITVNL